MAGTGKDASYSYAGTLYDGDDCLQNWTLNDAINKAVYQCNGYDKAAVGTRVVTFAVPMALAANDTAKIAALTPGTTGTWEGHPGGDSAGNIEATSTEAVLVRANKSAPVNNVITIDCEFHLNDLTLGAAV